MAYVFKCDLEDKLTRGDLMHHLHKRYVDDTLARMPSAVAATVFLTALNGLHSCLTFTIELPVDNKIRFIGIDIVKNRERKLKLKFTEILNQQTLDCCYTSIVTPITKRYRDFHKDNVSPCLCLILYNRGFFCRMFQITLCL